MEFNSYSYMLFFLPIILIGYFLFNRFKSFVGAKCWLSLASVLFYLYLGWETCFIIICSVVVNYTIGVKISKIKNDELTFFRLSWRKLLFIFGVVANILYLIYFKYYNFFINNINILLKDNIPLLGILWPLGISFITFQQISFLADAYSGKTSENNFIDYFLFVMFFPQILAGPIVRHKEFVPQLYEQERRQVDYNNICCGLMLFSVGLFKKVFVAESFARWSAIGFDKAISLSFFDAWASSLSFTFQIYYDFSGYTDMAIGSALLFNLRIPHNFNSPYKATSISDFWHRWHITLSRWLRDYIYIPLGGNRQGDLNTYRNLFFTFLIGGIWHGARWTFVVWGILHGIGIIIQKIWNKYGVALPGFLAWATTFIFINFSWVFFRAESLGGAMKILKGMVGLNGIAVPSYMPSLAKYGMAINDLAYSFADIEMIMIFMTVFGIYSFLGGNTIAIQNRFKISIGNLLLNSLLLACSIAYMSHEAKFVYFNF